MCYCKSPGGKAMSRKAILNEQERRNLRGFIDKWRENPHQVFPNEAIEHIEKMFAPYLQREFPRAAIQKIADYYGTNNLTTEALVNDLERLWNGEVPAETCPTCGGSVEGECKHEDKEQIPTEGWFWCYDCGSYVVPCPDCKQHTFLRKDGLKYPDQRKGQQR